MGCFHPLQAWWGRHRGGPTTGKKEGKGKGTIVWKKEDSCGVAVQLPCGRCIGCRLEYSRQWAMRCMHEASLHEDNCFVTLTYDDEHLPSDGSLNKAHFQDFMKRLRARFTGETIRYYHCGEYGEKFSRPHYHACIFGFDFYDRDLFTERGGTKLYSSKLLSDLWPFGFSSVGDVTFESAAYVARYVLKKVTGDKADDHYMRLHEVTGELNPVAPEYVTMSRGSGTGLGGIGHEWYKRYAKEVFPRDEVIVRGTKCKPPKYYGRLLEESHAEQYEEVKKARKKGLKKLRLAGELSEARLRDKEKCAEARIKLLKRGIEKHEA